MMPPVSSRSIRASARWKISAGLLDQAHARNIRILMDFVPNHWSDEHPTFV
ncbi:MAG: alpha-amylase family glycosyl hydrolase [Chromatiales bacterium]|nr:alpha-amylase family glycosyl hydrolase [Chromatiales bacterium]